MSDVYSVQKKSVTVTGMCSMGWMLGLGYTKRRLSVSADRWCVIRNGKAKPIAVCPSEKEAVAIAMAMGRAD